MALNLNSQYFIAELKCLIIQARSPSVDISEGAKVEAAIWGAIEEIAGVDGLKKERLIFERLYACSSNGRVRKK